MSRSALPLSWALIAENWAEISHQKATLDRLASKGGKLELSTCGEKKRLCVKVDLKELAYGNEETQEFPWRIPEGY